MTRMSHENPEHLSEPTPADGAADDALADLCLANGPAALRERIAPASCALRHLPRQGSAAPPSPSYRDVPRSVPCAAGEWRCRDPRDPPQIPPRCDAPRTVALRRHCGNAEPSLSVSLSSSSTLLPAPSAITSYLVLVRDPRAHTQPHRGIELRR